MIFVLLLLTCGTIGGLAGIALLHKSIKTKISVLTLLSISFILFSGYYFLLVISFINISRTLLILIFFLGTLNFLFFILYCIHIKTESLTSLKVIPAVSLTSIILTIVSTQTSKIYLITLSPGISIWIFKDSSLLIIQILYIVYTGIIFLDTFFPAVEHKLNKKHLFFLKAIIIFGVLGLIGVAINVICVCEIWGVYRIPPQTILFSSLILIALFPFVIFATTVFDIDVLWALSFSLDALYVFHSSGITVFSFDFSDEKKRDSRDILISSILSALIVAIKEVTGETSLINRISLEDKTVYLKKSGELYFAMFCKRPNKTLYNAFVRFVNEFVKDCAEDIVIQKHQTVFVKNAYKGYEIIKRVFPVF